MRHRTETSGGTSTASNFKTKTEYEQSRADTLNAATGTLEGYDCPICKNRGYIAEVKDDRVVTVRCGCMEVRNSLQRASASGLGDMLKSYTFDSYLVPEEWQRNAKRAALEYVANPSGWFLSSGAVGSGKSHICTAICGELLKAGRSVRYILWKDEIAQIKAFAMDGTERRRLIDPLKEAEILYIDDFLKVGRGEEPTKADIDIAFEIISARYNQRDSITIISTERSLPEILDMDEALGSRIYERSKLNYLRIEGQGKNWRLR